MPESIEVLQDAPPFVLEDQETLALHFNIDAMQSMMSRHRPFDLELPYTRTMMGFLLAKPHPVHILMIGLGGGSLAKFCYQNLPHARITVVEINPQVIAMRQQFLIPEDNDRFKVVCADGADFVRAAPPGFDVVLVDGFDAQGLSLELCTLAFYENCYRIMLPSSVLVVNSDNEHPEHPAAIGRIDQAFEGNFIAIDVLERNNSIVFANKDLPISGYGMSLSWSLGHQALEARTQLQTELQRILEILDSREPVRNNA
jgi:spermidine synthase